MKRKLRKKPLDCQIFFVFSTKNDEKKAKKAEEMGLFLLEGFEEEAEEDVGEEEDEGEDDGAT